MAARWFFRKKRPGEKIRNPIQGEFFATEAIEGPAQALVRESLQNSLDAATSRGLVRVRITLATGEKALSPAETAWLFAGAWPHFAAPGNGLYESPTPDSFCPYVVVEDFGTKGLTGDPADSDPAPGVINPFFLFFRAEGLSAKTGTELGRWGVGKFVFPRSSQASTHFGITIRHDDQRRLLLGAITLKAHRVPGDLETFTPDGLYGKLEGDDFILPIESPETIDRFCRLFSVTRNQEPGLSVIVPFIDPDITSEKLLVAAVKDYFLPIIHGQLEVEIYANGEVVQLTADSLDEIIREHGESIGDNIRGHVALAHWANRVSDDDRLVLESPDPTRAARWSDALVPEPARLSIRDRLATRQPVAVRMPVTVRSKANGSNESYFDIYFTANKASDGRPLFVREGIIVSDVRGARAREITSLVVIEDQPLATMLGDSENPAHTQWQKDSSNFKGRYTYGPGLLDFVVQSVGQLFAILSRGSDEGDPSLTIDFFSIELPDEEDLQDADTPTSQRKKGDKTGKPTITVERRLSKIIIRQHGGGFVVMPGKAPPATPFLLEVRCAYDIRSGNALKKWDPADFSLESAAVKITCEGHVELKQARGNWLLLQVNDSEFHASVSGFDEARDLYVRVDVRESSNANSKT